MTAFNIGQGNCVLLKHGGNAIMIDAGTLSAPEQENLALVENRILKEVRDTRVRAIVITHRDTDHWKLLLDAGRGTVFYNIRQAIRDTIFREGNRSTIILGGRIDDDEDALVAMELIGSLYSDKIKGMHALLENINPLTTQINKLPKKSIKYQKLVAEKAKFIENGRKLLLPLAETLVLFTEDNLKEGGYGRLRRVLNDSLGLNACADDEGFRPLLPESPIITNNPNDRSFVFSFSRVRTDPSGARKLNSLLFTGDATGITLESLIGGTGPLFERNKAILNATNVAVLPHHGSDSHDSQLWQAYMFSSCPQFFCGIYSIDSDVTKFFHPKSIILGESVSKASAKISFSYCENKFIFSENTLYLLDKSSLNPLYKTNVVVGTPTVGNFSARVLEAAKGLIKSKDTCVITTPGELDNTMDTLSCRIETISIGSRYIDVIVPDSKTDSHLCIPHEQSFFYKDGSILNRVVTTFPVYTTGDTSLGYCKIILDSIGGYFIINPGKIKDKIGTPAIAGCGIEVPTFDMIYDLIYGFAKTSKSDCGFSDRSAQELLEMGITKSFQTRILASLDRYLKEI